MLLNTEAQIRDLVAANLGGIDPHLRLLQTEHVVKRADGTEARIDILAKDDFGCYTVIEIKKSAQTSRSAVQQLYKYASFLKSVRRLEGHQIRCVIVSTVWGELLAPFGEFKHFSDYESHGYQLDFDDTGTPIYREIETKLEPGGASPAPSFIFFEFRNQEDRDASLHEFTEVLKKLPSLNSLVVPANYAGGSSSIVNPFGFSWSLFSGNAAEVELELAQLLPNTPASTDDEFLTEEHPECQEYVDPLLHFQSRILLNFVHLTAGEWAEFALHSFNNTLNTWKIAEPQGFGPMHASGFFEPSEVLDLASGLLGDHPYIFVASATGARPSHLAAIRARLHKFLATNTGWRVAVNTIFSELDSEDILSINVFNPLNFFGLLNDLYREGRSDRIPAMRIERRHADGHKTIYHGALLWTETHKELSARAAIRAAYPNETVFAIRRVNQRLNQHDEKLTRIYGLTYEVMRESGGTEKLLEVKDGAAEWRDAYSVRTLQDFVDHHSNLVAEVGEYFVGCFADGRLPSEAFVDSDDILNL